MTAKAAVSLVCMVVLFTVVGTQQASPAAAPRRVVITAHRFTYDPDAVTLKKDQPVTLVLESSDVTHGLRVRELGLNMKASKGKPSEMTFTPDKAGDFTGHCSVFCGAKHGTMMITFHVVD